MDNGKERLYQLDLMRFVAALAVLLFHYSFRGFAGGHLSPLEFPVLNHITKYGYLGVDMFFVISGFVIFMSVQSATLKEFIASRVARLFPAYWVAVTLTTVVILYAGIVTFSVSMKKYLINMTMLNGLIKVENVDGVYWSLLIELKFYALVAVILFFNKLPAIKVIISFWLAIAVCYMICPFGPMISKGLNALFITEWCPYFAAGIIFYLIKRDGRSADKLALLLVCLFLAVRFSLVRMIATQAAYSTGFSKGIIIGLIACIFITFFLFVDGKLQFLNKPYFWILGALTYPLYLIHQFIGYILFYQFQYCNKYLVLATVIGLMLVLSYLINRLVENKLGPLLKRLIIRIPL
jgi:peptidoglycan/LPS O-acetylase OafA/YrhL